MYVVLGTYRFHALMPHAASLYQKFIEKDLFSQKAACKLILDHWILFQNLRRMFWLIKRSKTNNQFTRLSLIVRVNVVLNRTVVVDWSDWRYDNLCGSHLQMTLKMSTAQVVETSVTVNNNSPIQDYVHPDDQTQPNKLIVSLWSFYGSKHSP